ncbi:MAG: hypothetical protein C0514_02860 [Candidatus Puniceispirillum sp.]|nr:hypothetical protein [Candidatus Puniceispirillum sp.]
MRLYVFSGLLCTLALNTPHVLATSHGDYDDVLKPHAHSISALFADEELDASFEREENAIYGICAELSFSLSHGHLDRSRPHKRVRMLREGLEEVRSSSRYKRVRTAHEEALELGHGIPALPGQNPSPLLSAKDCRITTQRLLEESRNPKIPTEKAVQLLETAKAHALHVLIRAFPDATAQDHVIAADILHDACDYEWAKKFYEHAIRRDANIPRATYLRLLGMYEDDADLEDAERVLGMLVNHPTHAKPKDQTRLDAIRQMIREDESLHAHALQNGLYGGQPANLEDDFSTTEDDLSEL